MTCANSELPVVNEESVFRYRARVKDPAGTVVTSFTDITLTLYDLDTGTIINSREGTDVNGLNGGSIAVDGWFTWLGTAADAAIIDPTKLKETHVALFHFEWAGGEHNQEYPFQVKNLGMVGEEVT